MTVGAERRIRSLIDDNVRLVRYTLARAGVPESDIDDELQRTFITATRRIADIEPGAERSFLIQVARNIGAHWRRASSRRREVPSDGPIEGGIAIGTPEDSTLQKEARSLLDEVVAALPQSLRAVFIRFEIDAMNMGQIASQLHIPRGTVASRLRRARKQLRESIAAIDHAWDVEVDEWAPPEEPALLRREKVSALARALLESGAPAPRRPATRARTLAACLAVLSRESGDR